jgi:hypothetical protein
MQEQHGERFAKVRQIAYGKRSNLLVKELVVPKMIFESVVRYPNDTGEFMGADTSTANRARSIRDGK